MEAKLIDVMGSDDRVSDAARVSFAKLSSEYTTEQNNRLIQYLARHNHFTPFTHPQITLHEKIPIFVARQRFKHTIGFTYNEISKRYVDDTPDFYIPDVWRGRPEGSVKQGSSDKIVDKVIYDYQDGNMERSIYDEYKDLLESVCELYNGMIYSGVAPEQARMVLPQSMYTEVIVTGSLAAWARAYKLRIDSHSQKEIQTLAVEWDKIIRPLFPISWPALLGE